MERAGRLSVVSVAIACLLSGPGCTMCPDPYDYAGPVPNGSVAQNDFHARSNGIVPLGSSPRPWPPLVDASGTRDTVGDGPTIVGATDPADSPDGPLEIPAADSVLVDEPEVASEPETSDEETVRMLSAAEAVPAEAAATADALGPQAEVGPVQEPALQTAPQTAPQITPQAEPAVPPVASVPLRVESPPPPAAPAVRGPNETPGWRPRGYARPANRSR